MIKRRAGVAVYTQLADLLRRQIEDGTYRPGDRLPSERQLADAHGMSVESVRKATGQLRIERLIEVRRGYGTTVAIPDDPDDLAVVPLQRGALCRIRPATRREREELDLTEGGWVLEERLGARVRVYAADQSLFRIS